MSIGHPLTRSPPPAFDRSTIEEEGDGRDKHGSAATAFELGSPENPIVVDAGGDEGCIGSKPGSAHCPIVIDERDNTPQHEDAELDSGPGIRAGSALLCGSDPEKRQKNYGHSHEGSPVALSRTEDTGGQHEWVVDERDVDLLPPTALPSLDASRGETPVEPDPPQ